MCLIGPLATGSQTSENLRRSIDCTADSISVMLAGLGKKDLGFVQRLLNNPE
jgi:hypothetical protein